MDRARPSYSAATTVTVATETCHLFFLSATDESLELVLTLCHFIAMLRASQSLEYVVLNVLAGTWQLLLCLPFNHTLHRTCWQASHCVSSFTELFGPC